MADALAEVVILAPEPDADERERRNPDDKDSDDLSDDEIPHAPASLNERRRAQKAIFEDWLASDVGRKAIAQRTKRQKVLDADNEELSITEILSKQGEKIISTPRQYQLELFERAKQENCIAVLDTGSGKTLIATLLLRHTIDQELENRAKGMEPKTSFFLVASVALCHQQCSVLQTNLDHKVSRVSGTDGVDTLNKARWATLLTENKVIVATADVLLQCLAHSIITMNQINLLIFDEAHHTKKNHAYARIIKDHYIDNDGLKPRVFGMTASPIDAKTDVEKAARELEALLDCRIATTTDMSLTESIKKPKELVMSYDPLSREGFETPFVRSIKSQIPAAQMFQHQFDKSAEIARHLGRWCADQYLINALSERRSKRLEQEANKKYYNKAASTDGAPRVDSPNSEHKATLELDEAQAVTREVIDFVEKEKSKYISISDQDLSPKVLKLKCYLEAQFERATSRLCIVFVQARHTARLLNAVFMQKRTEHMRPGYLIGSGSADIDEENYTNRTQVVTVDKFKRGQINCLFATSVAEEGLDVPSCNLVVRFDMYSTMIQYVQSRGRARDVNSTFIHMIEKGNSIDIEMVREVRSREAEMRHFCQALPEDRRLEGNEDLKEHLMAKEKNLRVYTEPTTGAKLTYGSALGILANFVSAVPTETNEDLFPTYVVSKRGMKFQAEVQLPAPTPISFAVGRVCTKRTLAKRSAAFEACIELRRKQYMDEWLRPTYQKKLPALRNALLAVGNNQSDQYVMRTKPSIWAATRGTLPTELYAIVVDFSNGLNYAHRPLVMLTRTPMPQFPEFPVYLDDGSSSSVRSRSFASPVSTGSGAIEKLTAFTFRIFRDLFSKTYEENGEHLSYWLAPAAALDDPLPPAHDEAPSRETPAKIDWPLVDEVFANKEYKWTPDTSPESLLGKFIVDQNDGTRKFYLTAHRPDLKPTDAVPADAAKHKYSKDILNYSNSLWKQSRAAREGTWNLEQPVFEAAKVLVRRNVLSPPGEKEMSLRTKAWICLEPLRISVLPPDVAESCFAWPAIIYRMESNLIAMEACSMVGVQCSPKMALAAVTKDSDNSGDHETTTRLNFQSGMGENYERLEFIGDTFLKTVTTIATYIQNPNDQEFAFHCTRMSMLCNKNLFEVAVEMKLYEYIRSMGFSKRLWYPEGMKLLDGKGINKDEDTAVIKHGLGEKTIADVCEALIGAAFVTHDKPGEPWKPSHWEHGVRAVTTLVKSEHHLMKEWTDYSAAYDLPTYQTGEVSASQRDLAEKVEREHPYHFKYPKLLRSAFIHPSMPFIYEKVPNYQRLEFLGDALLDQASIAYLFYRFPDKDPQWLTEHKMAMVSNKFLGAVCVNIGFYKHLRHNHAQLQHQVNKYVAELEEAKRVANGARDYWTDLDPPKCLPDIVEAYVGAIFLDSDFNFDVVQQFFEQHVKWYFEDMNVYDGFANNHPCTHLHIMLQTAYGCQDYRLMTYPLPSLDSSEKKEVVCAVMIHNEVVSSSKGKSARYARLRVAHEAIESINGLAPFEFRTRFGCNCAVKEKLEGQTEAPPAVCSV